MWQLPSTELARRERVCSDPTSSRRRSIATCLRYALFGFRIDALHTLSGSNVPLNVGVHSLIVAGERSGLFIVGLGGFWTLRRDSSHTGRRHTPWELQYLARPATTNADLPTRTDEPRARNHPSVPFPYEHDFAPHTGVSDTTLPLRRRLGP